MSGRQLRVSPGLARAGFWVCIIALVLFLADLAVVLFGGGVNVSVSGFGIRSTTLEFPLIGLSCSLVCLLLVSGRLQELVLLVGSIVVALVLAEGLLRVTDHPLSKPFADYAVWYRPSEIFGHELFPGFEGFGPLNVPIRINSQGFRDGEHAPAKPSETIRILGLGDSFLFGWGVSVEDVFLKQLERMLRQATGRDVESMNTGVPGWGLNQYYLYLKKFGARDAPDLVVLAYFVDDLPGPLQESLPPNLQFQEQLRFKGGMLHHSRFYNFFKFLSDRVREKNRHTRVDYLHDQDARRREWSKLPRYMMVEGERETDRLNTEHLENALDRIRLLTEQIHATLVVMYIPDISQLHHPEVQHVNEVLETVTRKHRIPFVDMTKRFEAAGDSSAFYLWPKDPHTNAQGHLEMARALLKLICDSSALAKAPCRPVN